MNGNALADGDSVTVIKDLKIKGTSSVVTVGTKVRNIRLVDGDPAANNGGWQWSAGTGTDAAPYFRVFNPVTQGRKFDPNGDYVRRWLPALAGVPTAAIHEPWRLSAAEQRAAGCVLGRDYPFPIVDHALARQRALDAFGAQESV